MFGKKRRDPFEILGKSITRTLNIESVFIYGDFIPDKYTCRGEDLSPPLSITGIPENTNSLVVIVYDVDVPTGVFYHWTLYNAPVVNEIPEGIPKEPSTQYGFQGLNDFGKIGYCGPCPKEGDKIHHYIILVLAVTGKLKLKPGAKPENILESIRNRVLGYGVSMFVYGGR
ncbi:MAG: YbhB/YbcL family Raf kinase inhibitor-like protein [Desulfurococcaceae archaeon]